MCLVPFTLCSVFLVLFPDTRGVLKTRSYQALPSTGDLSLLPNLYRVSCLRAAPGGTSLWSLFVTADLERYYN